MDAPPAPSGPPRPVAPVYRRAAANPRSARELVFDRLPAAVRDRLANGILHGAPEPLLAARSGAAPLALRALLLGALGAGLTLFVAATRGLGELGPQGQQPLDAALVYAPLFLVAALATAGFVALRRHQRGVPFRSGRYLFALDLVEVAGGRLRVTALDTLRDVEARPREVALIFADGHEVAFRLGKREDAAARAARVKGALTAARGLSYPDDEVALQRLDPFFEVRVTDDWDAAAAPAAPGRARLAWVAAAATVAALPAGFGVVAARNAVSDDFMFEEARADRGGRAGRLEDYLAFGRRHRAEAAELLVREARSDRAKLRRYLDRDGALAALADDAYFELIKGDPGELSAYLGHGGRHVEEADDAAFAIARRVDTVASYRTYLEHGTRHAEEVRGELLLEADFTQAIRSSQVGALFSFVRRNPGSKHDDEAWQRIRTTYGGIPAHRAEAHPSADGARFVEALLTALQDRADPRVTLDVQVEPATSVADADAVLGARYGARYLPAASRFSEGALAELARDVRAGMGGWFGRDFPHGVVEIARPSAEDEARPRLEVRCTPVASGSAQWRAPGAAGDEPAHVTPLVAFLVEVRGVAPGRDGKDVTVTWKARLEDTTDGKMLASDFQGRPRPPAELLEDAFARFLAGVPDRIAGGFLAQL
jgi:hypothetical protein